MEAVRTSEPSVHFNVTTRRYTPEDSKLHAGLHKNLKSHIFSISSTEPILILSGEGGGRVSADIEVADHLDFKGAWSLTTKFPARFRSLA
jgi:hypothetical protein